MSPPARVAWIETAACSAALAAASVATREGGVDRNISSVAVVGYKVKSPPARVAWIET